jgi:hypothetical protein
MAKLTLKDIANSPHHFLVVDDLSGTCLSVVHNPRTGRPFAVGDVVSVRGSFAYSQDAKPLVELEGVKGIFFLDAFRMPTEHDLRKSLIDTVNAPKDQFDTMKGFLKASAETVAAFSKALDAGGYAQRNCPHVVCGQTKDEKCALHTIKEAMSTSHSSWRTPIIEEDTKTVGPDQESWVKQRIETAIQMGIAAYRATHVRADAPALSSAINGIANGVAVEVIRTLGLKPGYVNLRAASGDVPVNSAPPPGAPLPKDKPRSHEPRTCWQCQRTRPRHLLEWKRGQLVCTDVYSCIPAPRAGKGGGYGA